ncbi:pep-cterm sorting domain-containing protein [Anaeramoeba flamelloides]|uniref:Pep-cterm sorting domain-containing protein n=1 Tax=Anaeramoeba flamelloides TaxID=1746091 RepID=A0ABQ8Y8U1_9EUKA|nr:pep-cterm sorting domain-containing protein [Anaeramoeba flamelloides]
MTGINPDQLHLEIPNVNENLIHNNNNNDNENENENQNENQQQEEEIEITKEKKKENEKNEEKEKEKEEQEEEEVMEIEITPVDRLLGSWVNNRDMSDIKFLVGKDQTPLYGHQLILSMSSPVWRGMFYTREFRETSTREMKVIKIPDIEGALFEEFLRFLYSRKIIVKEGNLFPLYWIGDRYCVFELQEHCTEQFQKCLTLKNCITNYSKTIEWDIPSWRKIALQFLSENSKTMFTDNTCFRGFPAETVREMLSMQSLQSSEILLFRSLLNWGKELQKKSQFTLTLKEILNPFLPLIQLNLLNFRQLEEVYETKLYGIDDLLQNTFLTAKRNNIKIRMLSRAGPKLKDLKVLLLGYHRRGEDRVNAFCETIKSGGIETVDIIDPSQTTPDFEQMKNYDAIVLRSANSASLQQPDELGNSLAQFVDSGKGLVIIAVNTMINTDNPRIRGRILDDNYIPLAQGNRVEHNDRSLGIIHVPDHPIMQGVNTFETKTYTHVIDSNDINGGTLIASWTNGAPLITEKQKDQNSGVVVVINTHPTSTRTTNDCGKAWKQETDGMKLFSNSVAYVGLKSFKK